jgi:hypothetical protein
MTRDTALLSSPGRAHRVQHAGVIAANVALAAAMALTYWALRPADRARAALDACVAARLHDAYGTSAMHIVIEPDARTAQHAAALYACSTQP